MKTSIQKACWLMAAGLAMSPAFVLAMPSADRMSPSTPNAQGAMASAMGAGSFAAPANIFTPASSHQMAGEEGKRAHTNYFLHNAKGIQPTRLQDLAVAAPAMEGDSVTNTAYEYPASLACVYGMGKSYAGCYPTNNKAYNAKGGERAIAIVDAFDDPTAASDLSYFSKY